MIIGSGRIEDLALRLARATGEDVETAIELESMNYLVEGVIGKA